MHPLEILRIAPWASAELLDAVESMCNLGEHEAISSIPAEREREEDEEFLEANPWAALRMEKLEAFKPSRARQPRSVRCECGTWFRRTNGRMFRCEECRRMQRGVIQRRYRARKTG